MKRFLPYLRYLRGRRTALGLALLCGAISGAVYGFGMPRVINDIFPRIFTDAAGASAPAPALGARRLADLAPGADAPAAARREQAARTRAGRTLSVWEVGRYALLIPLIFLVRALMNFLNNYLMNYCGIGVLEALRVELYRKLQYLPLSYFGRNRTGDLLSRLTVDTQLVQQTLTSTASDLVIQPVTLLGAIFFLGLIAWRNEGAGLFLASLAAVPLCVFPVRFVGKKLLRRAQENQRLLGDISDLASQNLSAAREVRAFGLEEREVGRFQQTTRTLFTSQMKVVKYSQLLSPLIEVIASLGVAVSLFYAYYEGLSLTVFVSILVALFACYDPMKKLGSLHAQFTRGGAALTRIEEILQADVAITDPPRPVPAFAIRGDVAFEDVGFSYREGEPVLAHIDVRIPAGTVCALVGPSGAGKSTFANLVPRFYDVSSGRVTLDGHDIRDLRVRDLRQAIAVVAQEPVLFNDTILANLRLGRPDATRAEIEAAAASAYAHDFIAALPRGYDTLVGERGALLSGGQRQRLALARAFLRNAPLLILDEATSALDGESEAAIQLALKQLVVGKTVFIIAHRFSTIRDASRILVFDEGALVAAGTHQDLHAGNALYRSLYNRQQLTAVEPPGVL